ncbi:MAG: hypothetical protein EAZ08_10645 [Cytophagales bacterium]|nr:MAG: hypothetical protein EAZ08_10645 [Cytophagales bacterium]
MKITTILKSFVFVFALVITQDSQAQFLKKLKEKVGQAGEAGFGGGDKDWNGFALPTEKDGQKDLENTKLDGTTFTKDKLDISGIYVSQKAIGLSTDLSRGVEITIQKFAVQASPDCKKIVFTHLGTTNIIKNFVVKPTNENDPTGTDLKLLEKGIILNAKFANETEYRWEGTYTDSIDYQDKIAKNGRNLDYISTLEPGVFVMHELVRPVNGVTTCVGGSLFKDEADKQAAYLKYYPFNLIYKKGKNVSKWTKEAIVKELLRQSDIRCAMVLGANAANATMPNKITFKEEPSNADLLKAAQARAKEFGWKETIISVYPIKEWSNVIKQVGPQLLNTLVAREMNIVAVMKTPSGECAFETIVVRMDNAYTVGSQTENYAGKKVYHWANGDLNPIDCSKIKK